MKKRPMTILLLAVLQFITPLGNWALTAWLSHEPITAFLKSGVHQSPALFLLASFLPYLLSAAAIFSVKEWSYPVFLSVTAWNLYCTFSSLSSPGAAALPTFQVISSACLASAVNLGLVTYFLIPAVRAPYFNRKLRWWESKPRYQIEIEAKVDLFGQQKSEDEKTKIPCQIVNLSQGGAFLKTGQALGTRERIVLSFQYTELTLILQAEVVHENPGEGVFYYYGARFVDLGKESRMKLKRLIQALDLLGFPRRPEKANPWIEGRRWVRSIYLGIQEQVFRFKTADNSHLSEPLSTSLAEAQRPGSESSGSPRLKAS